MPRGSSGQSTPRPPGLVAAYLPPFRVPSLSVFSSYKDTCHIGQGSPSGHLQSLFPNKAGTPCTFSNTTQAPVQVMCKHHASHPLTPGSVRPPPVDTRAHRARKGDGTHTPAGGGWDPQAAWSQADLGASTPPRLRTRILGYLCVPATNHHVAGGPPFPPSCKPCAFLHHCPRNHPAPCTQQVAADIALLAFPHGKCVNST